MLPPFERDGQLDAGALSGRGGDNDLTAELRCALLHIAQAISVRGGLRRRSSGETAAVVANLAVQFTARGGEAEPHAVRLSVAGNVVDRFFEDQEEVTALFGVELDLLQPGRDLEIPVNAARNRRSLSIKALPARPPVA